MPLPVFFFLLLLLLAPPPAAALTDPGDVAALRAFKFGISPSSITPWSCLASWNFSSDPCSQSSSSFLCGLTCSFSGAGAARIAAVTLDPAGYSGVLTPLLSNLTALLHLDISGNSFHGPIPSSISTLTSLQTLILSSNTFSGEVPATLANLSSLQFVDLSRNRLSGSIPPSMSAMTHLSFLDLSSNRLSGELPATLPPRLVELALSGNRLAGTLERPAFGAMDQLEVVELGENRFEGEIGAWFLNLPSIQQIDLANNSIVAVDVGAGGGGRLVALDLGFNRIEGRLPVGLAAFPSLVSLSLRHNRLRGPIPWEYSGGKKGDPFRRLFLDGNFLNGKVPEKFVGAGDGDGLAAGSFGDNCLDGCREAAPPMCSPEQKPEWVCREVYSVSGRGRHRR